MCIPNIIEPAQSENPVSTQQAGTTTLANIKRKRIPIIENPPQSPAVDKPETAKSQEQRIPVRGWQAMQIASPAEVARLRRRPLPQRSLFR